MSRTSSRPATGERDQAARAAGVVVVDDVGVAFGGVAALQDISLTIRANEVLAIVGPNGAGKTTLLNVLSGLTAAASGHVSVLGTPTTKRTSAQIARLGVGRSFQDPKLLEQGTVVDNLMCGANSLLDYTMLDEVLRPWRVRGAERAARDRAYEVCEFVGLRELADTEVHSLSYGTHKLVDIGRALMQRPRLLLLDEPTSGLDAGERAEVLAMLNRLKHDNHTTMILVEHHMDLVRGIATHVVGLQAGSVLSVGTPAEVLDSESFRAALVGANASTSPTV